MTYILRKVTQSDSSTMEQIANCCLIFSAFVATFVAILVGLYHNQVMPEGMPDDQQISLRVCGVGMNILGFLVRAQTFLRRGRQPEVESSFLWSLL